MYPGFSPYNGKVQDLCDVTIVTEIGRYTTVNATSGIAPAGLLPHKLQDTGITICLVIISFADRILQWEPPFPPVFAAVANALYKATGKRFYDQPYGKDIGLSASKM